MHLVAHIVEALLIAGAFVQISYAACADWCEGEYGGAWEHACVNIECAGCSQCQGLEYGECVDECLTCGRADWAGPNKWRCNSAYPRPECGADGSVPNPDVQYSLALMRACFPNAVVTGPEATGGEPEMASCPDFLVERYTGIPGNAAYNHRDTITKVDVSNTCDNRYDATDQSKRLNRYSVAMASSQDNKYEYWMGIYGCTNDNKIMPQGPSSWYSRWAKRTANAWKLDVCGRASSTTLAGQSGRANNAATWASVPSACVIASVIFSAAVLQ